MNELMSCPFCGAVSAVIISDDTTSYPKEEFYVECCDCNARAASCESIENAANGWNRRASVTVLPYKKKKSTIIQNPDSPKTAEDYDEETRQAMLKDMKEKAVKAVTRNFQKYWTKERMKETFGSTNEKISMREACELASEHAEASETRLRKERKEEWVELRQDREELAKKDNGYVWFKDGHVISRDEAMRIISASRSMPTGIIYVKFMKKEE